MNVDEFWARIDRSGGPDACWPWTGTAAPIGPNGLRYGYFNESGRKVYAHRRALGLARGRPLERREIACHRCDNPPCCNPAHLYAGTKSTNGYDCVAAGNHSQARKTHCPRGHEYTAANTYVYPRGSRECRICRAAYGAKAYRARKAAMVGGESDRPR